MVNHAAQLLSFQEQSEGESDETLVKFRALSRIIN